MNMNQTLLTPAQAYEAAWSYLKDIYGGLDILYPVSDTDWNIWADHSPKDQACRTDWTAAVNKGLQLPSQGPAVLTPEQAFRAVHYMMDMEWKRFDAAHPNAPNEAIPLMADYLSATHIPIITHHAQKTLINCHFWRKVYPALPSYTHLDQRKVGVTEGVTI